MTGEPNYITRAGARKLQEELQRKAEDMQFKRQKDIWTQFETTREEKRKQSESELQQTSMLTICLRLWMQSSIMKVRAKTTKKMLDLPPKHQTHCLVQSPRPIRR